MADMHLLYHNKFGVAFQWKRNSAKDLMKIQLVFRDTGLKVSKKELTLFLENIKHTKDSCSHCSECSQKESYKALLVDSPAPQVSFAMNMKELDDVQDLVEGTLFQLNLDNFIRKLNDD